MFIDYFDISFLSCPFFCKVLVLGDCVLFVDVLCQMVKALCTNELIADCFCAGWSCNSAYRYLPVCVGVFSVHLIA